MNLFQKIRTYITVQRCIWELMWYKDAYKKWAQGKTFVSFCSFHNSLTTKADQKKAERILRVLKYFYRTPRIQEQVAHRALDIPPGFWFSSEREKGGYENRYDLLLMVFGLLRFHGSFRVIFLGKDLRMAQQLLTEISVFENTSMSVSGLCDWIAFNYKSVEAEEYRVFVMTRMFMTLPTLWIGEQYETQPRIDFLKQYLVDRPGYARIASEVWRD